MSWLSRAVKSVRGGVSAFDPKSSKSLADRARDLGHSIATVSTGGLIDAGPAAQAARWVDPSTKAGRRHLAVVGVTAATVAATVVTAGSAAPAGAAGIAAMLAAGTAAAAQGASKIAGLDAAENAQRAAARDAAAAAQFPTDTEQQSNPSEPPTFRQWLAHFFGR